MSSIMVDNCNMTNITDTMNYTNSTETIHLTGSIFITFNVLLMLFICGGNALTIIAVWRTPVLKTVPNMYVVSLAVADFIVGLSLSGQTLIHIPSMKVIIQYSKYLCLFQTVVFYISMLASIFSMVSIAFDRLLYIKHPLRYERLSKVYKATLFIICAWVVSILFGTIPLYYNKWNPCIGCGLFKVIKIEFQIYMAVSIYILCCILTVCCYGYILYIARKHQNAIGQLETDPTKRNQRAGDMKLVRLFGLVFGIFFACYLPVAVAYTIGHLGVAVPDIVMYITGSLAIFNSGMNFMVYAAKNKDFRQAFSKMLCPKKVHN